jgi:O-acetyl-ADP-ribose deacetylase (regulator of RNase III)
MIEFKSGDILKMDAEALVNTVNCVGIMGRGIALQFKNAFPSNFKAYAAACARREVQPGKMFVYDTGYVANPKYIINFPTKRHWRGKSRLEDIESGLRALVREVETRHIRSIALPPLGAGLGGLDWQDVRSRIESAFRTIANVRVTVFEPRAEVTGYVNRSTKVPNMTPGRAALLGLMERYLAGLMDPFVTLLEVHKLMYFMQEAGEELKLRYVKAPYGPFAENLRHVLLAIDGHFVSGYSDGGDAPDKPLSLVPGASDEAEAFLACHEEVQARFERVAELVEGFETPFGLELLATVHWVAKETGELNAVRVIERVYEWGQRKRQFTPRQISLALDLLVKKNWLSLPRSPEASA